MTDFVFVYGSLKKDYWNHQCLGTSPFVKEDFLTGMVLYRPYPDFPVMFEGNGIVSGEVYRVLDPSVWRHLSYLESEGVMYNKMIYETQSGMTVYTYLGNKGFWDMDKMVRIENGNWSRYND